MLLTILANLDSYPRYPIKAVKLAKNIKFAFLDNLSANTLQTSPFKLTQK